MPRNTEEDNLHSSMLRGMITVLGNDNIRIVQADLQGYDQPDTIGRKRPDIIGERQNGTRIIVEVETCSTVDMDHTREQFEDFSQAEGEFWVDVPDSCLRRLQTNTESWGINVNRWFHRAGA